MSMQQIMRWGHDFLRNREGECLTLSLWGKAMCQKETPKNVFPFPSCTHVFIFPHVLGSGGCFDHPSFMFSVFFPRFACPVHHLALTEMLWSILIILYSILFMHAMRSSCLQNCVLFRVVRLLSPPLAAKRFGVSFVC